MSPASGYLRSDHCPECKLILLGACGCVDPAEQRLCQGHVAGGGKPSAASRGVCGSDHTGQRTPAVAPTGRYWCACVCVLDPVSADSCYSGFVCSLYTGVPKSVSNCIVDVESMDIFPVGWCEANGYLLTPPLKPVCTYTLTHPGRFHPRSDNLRQTLSLIVSTAQKQKKIAVVQPEQQ